MLGLLIADTRQPGCHDFPVIRPVSVGLRCPSHCEIVAPDQRRRRLLAGIPGESRVAAKIAKVPVLPEDAHRCVVDDRLQQRFRVRQVGQELRAPVPRVEGIERAPSRRFKADDGSHQLVDFIAAGCRRCTCIGKPAQIVRRRGAQFPDDLFEAAAHLRVIGGEDDQDDDEDGQRIADEVGQQFPYQGRLPCCMS